MYDFDESSASILDPDPVESIFDFIGVPYGIWINYLNSSFSFTEEDGAVEEVQKELTILIIQLKGGGNGSG